MGMLQYYINKGYTRDEALTLANPPTSKPSRCRARWWFKPGIPVQTVPDKMLQTATHALVMRKVVYFEPKKPRDIR